MRRTLFTLVLLLISTISFSQKMKESYYEKLFASIIHGQTEVVLKDKSRVDIVTDTFAIEVDFAEKWAESVGQSLYYAQEMDKKPGVLLIIEGRKDDIYLNRLMIMAFKYNIRVMSC